MRSRQNAASDRSSGRGTASKPARRRSSRRPGHSRAARTASATSETGWIRCHASSPGRRAGRCRAPRAAENRRCPDTGSTRRSRAARPPDLQWGAAPCARCRAGERFRDRDTAPPSAAETPCRPCRDRVRARRRLSPTVRRGRRSARPHLSCVTSMPSASNASSMKRVSSLWSRLPIRVVPCANAASSNTRFDMLFEPGSCTTPSMWSMGLRVREFIARAFNDKRSRPCHTRLTLQSRSRRSSIATSRVTQRSSEPFDRDWRSPCECRRTVRVRGRRRADRVASRCARVCGRFRGSRTRAGIADSSGRQGVLRRVLVGRPRGDRHGGTRESDPAVEPAPTSIGWSKI